MVTKIIRCRMAAFYFLNLNYLFYLIKHIPDHNFISANLIMSKAGKTIIVGKAKEVPVFIVIANKNSHAIIIPVRQTTPHLFSISYLPVEFNLQWAIKHIFY